MKLGTVKEIKNQECRVGLTPANVRSYVARGHSVLVQAGAGAEAGFPDRDYAAVGARLVAEARQVFDECEMVVKVKEPLPVEYDFLHEGLILFTYLHLASSESLTRELLRRRVRAVAYETIEEDSGALPCLKPMSEIAGRLSVQEGAKYLEKTFGGRGVLLGGVPGLGPGKVAILGGGCVGANACKIAAGLGASVTVLDIRAERLEHLDDLFGTRISTLYSTDANLEEALSESDLVIGAVLVAGAKAPVLVRRHHLALMKKGAVIVDVAVDQGGCVETTHPTTHADPVFTVDGVVHYCVANMPGAVALTSTQALTSATLAYGLAIATHGLEAACRQSAPLRRGVNTYDGHCVCQPVAETFRLPHTRLEELLS